MRGFQVQSLGSDPSFFGIGKLLVAEFDLVSTISRAGEAMAEGIVRSKEVSTSAGADIFTSTFLRVDFSG